jgi:hypothetical protein
MYFPIIKTDIPLGIILIIVVPFGLIGGSIIYSLTPQKQAEDQAWNKNYALLEKKITNMNCNQLQQIRLDSIAHKDVSEYTNHWATIRDMYNALSCGNHWSVWED